MVASLESVTSERITLVRRTRALPLPGEVLVQPGQAVEPASVVARVSLRPGIPWVFPAARLIGVQESELPKCMLVKVGDKVKVKQPIARGLSSGLYGAKELASPTDGVVEDISDKSGRVVIREVFGKEDPPVHVDVAFDLGVPPRGLGKVMLAQVGDEVKHGGIIAKRGDAAAFYARTSKAPVSGVITKVDVQTGIVTISRPFKEVVIEAYLQGRVESIISQRGAVVEVPAVRMTGIFGVGKERHGVLKVLADSPSDVLSEDRITPDAEGKVLVGGSMATNEAVRKAMEVGARGIIAGSASYLNIVQALGVKLGVGITGQEDIALTLILTEGFGRLGMRAEIFERLQALEGRLACINGATQIRAGAIRPEVIVPFPEYVGRCGEEEAIRADLAEDLRVRVVNDPYFGLRGRTVDLPREPVAIETEATVPVCVVELDDGRQVRVPRANVEVL